MFSVEKFEKGINNINHHVEEKCFVSHMNKPYFILGPIKIEIIKQNQMQVIVFRSFLTDEEVEALKGYSTVEVS